jgi:hypothetical protein
VQDNLEEMAQSLAVDVLSFPGAGVIYAMGGAIPFADDQMNSLSPTRRKTAFLKAVVNEKMRDEYYSIFPKDADSTGDFPGSSCHNHAITGPKPAQCQFLNLNVKSNASRRMKRHGVQSI